MTMGELPLLSEAEKEELMAWAGGPSLVPEATVGALFEEQVGLTPDRVAVVSGGQSLTYADLNRRANRLARLLRTLGVGADQLVGICVERSAELIVGLLAILKAGGAYVPLDPTYPSDRLAFMLADTAAPVLLTQSHLRALLPAHSARVICLDTDLPALAEGVGASGDEANVDAGIKPQHLAYVSYTSGSTGRPKGVLIPHRAVVRLVRGSDFADLGPEDVFLQLAPVPFDASTLEIWGALLNGARLVVMPPHQPSLEELARALVEHRVSILWLTAGLFHLMVDHHLEALAGVRQVLAGGDVLSVPHVRRMLAALKPGHRLINGYGPTENTTFTCCYGMTAETVIESSVPIGRPIAGTQCYVLDENRQLVPRGVAGELYAGGDGLAHGYLNLPELTDERFVIGLSGERLYRTGDLVRWLPDGTLEFLGRTDNQVKIRGFRIELGEIEYHLGQHPAVGNCVVIARDEGGADKRLVAYAVPAGSADRPSARELRAYLADRLPIYMIPSAYVWLDALPLNPNGKVDRKVLPAPLAAELTAEYVAPRTPTEEVLVSIWAALLRVEQVGVLDDFFELGGHSLLATQVLSRMREHFGVELPLTRFFEVPTVAGLAERISGESGRREELPMVPVVRTSDLPLSFAQERLWFFDRLTPDSPLYNVAEAIRLRGPLQPALLEESLNRLVVRHEALRTNFAATGAGETQVVRPAMRLRLSVATVAEQDLPDLIGDEARAPFDLTCEPLIRARLLKVGEQDHLLLMTIHHIVVDGWSMGVLYAELGRIYEALKAGKEPDLAPLPLQYADFAAWQRQYLTDDVLSEQLDYWQRELTGAPTVLEMPTDKPRPAMQSFRGARCSRPFPAELMAQLQALSRREGATLFMTMLAAYQVLLHRYTGQDDLLAGVAIANRNRAETEGLIGFFVNTLAMRAEFAGQPSFRQFLQQVRRRALGAFAHQDLPLEKLVEALQPGRDPSRPPLVQTLFALQNAPMDDLQIDGVVTENLRPTGVDTGTAKYDLVVTVEESGGTVQAVVEYCTDLFEDATIERLLGHYETLLTGIAASPDRPVATLPMLSPAEEQQVLNEWSGGRAAYPERTVHALFAEQARLRPDAVAVVYGDDALTYRELDRRSSQLANRLIGLGVGPGAMVAFCLERSPLLMVAMLGILKAGGAYLPLDPDYPADRLAYMLQDSRTPVLLTQASLADRLPETGAPMIALDRDWAPQIAQESDVAPPDLTQPDDTAFVIYTSGSTGRPKGTVLLHRGIVRLLFATNYIQLSAEDRVAQTSSPSFDAATFEIWGALVHGATLVGIAKEVALVPPLLADMVRRERITVLFLTTALFNQVAREVPDAFNSVDTVLVGGEAFDVAVARAVRAAGGPRRLLNMYGPTESTTYATWYPISHVAIDAVSVPIGYPISSTTCYVLDRQLQPVPVGVPGEIYIGGDGLAREYLNQPDLTAQRFVHTPLGRLYRTGDLGKWLPGGLLEYLGRMDHQVKIRGFRIELGEIETALCGHGAISGAVVLVREDGAAGKQLVAYLTPEEAAQVPGAAELRSYLKARLPDYMVPAAFVVLDTFPLTPNGKVDRRALPAPDLADFVEREFAAPRTPAESALASVFADVLGLSRVSIHDSFFELGGHSLLATRVTFRVQEVLQVELSLRTLFERPTVAQLAEALAGRVEGVHTAPIDPAERGADLPLSFAQQRLWFLDQMAPDSALYNVPEGIYLTGPLDAGALAESLNRLAARHEILRTTFTARGKAPVQEIHDQMEVPLEQVDLTHLPEGERKAEAERLARAEARRPFDLTRLPLLRACLFKLGAAEHLLLLNMHHIVADGWSLGVLHAELSALYNACKSGREPALAPLPVQYADFALWQRQHLTGEELDRQQAYWLQELAGAPTVLALPTDKPRPAVQSYRGARCSRPLSADLMAKLDELARREGATPFMTMLAAFQTLLHRYTGQDDLLVGSAIAGRNRPETEGLIGFFVGTLPMRADFRQQPTFRQLLRQVRQRALGAFAHQDQPLEKLVEVLQPERNLSHSPLVQVLFALQNAHVGRMMLEGVTAAEMEVGGVHTDTAKYDLVLTVEQADSGAAALLEYSTDLFDDATVERLLGHYETLLTAIAADPDQPVATLPLLTPAEEQQVLHEWCGERTNYPVATVHALFAEQVRLRPEAVAVTYGDAELTYAELDRRSSQLANRLRGMGVRPDVLVGLCLERSPLLIVALLGILKAGGAYLPLDPDYPAERLAYMLTDSQTPVLLTQASLADRLPSTDATVIWLDAETSLAQESHVAPADQNQPDDLAYVIYTSGSTGRPKGTAIPHRAIVRLLFATNYIQLSNADRIAQVSNASFDAATFEIWGALLHGGTLVGITKDVALTPAMLAEALRRDRITAMFLTTSLFNQVARELPDAFGPVGTVIVGGEALDVGAIRAVLAAGGPQRLLNGYGPTESTTFATWYHITSVADDAVSVPIGYPLSSTTCYVLDRNLQPVPAGVPGEIYIGGDGLAREYLNQPDLTAQRFVNTERGRLYRTGDLVRWLPDGAIEFLGRLDHQIKLRGFRVELGEIETALTGHVAISGAAVMLRDDGVAGKQLVAYLTSAETGRIPDVAELRSYLKDTLPDYMIPAAFVALDTFPLTPNGKLDRRALPVPDLLDFVEREYAAPRTPVEAALAAVFAEVLGLNRVSIDDSFFDLGGHSLLATRVAFRIREALQVELPLRTLFERPTVAQLAEELSGRVEGVDTAPICPAERDTDLPLSFAQQRLWFLDQMAPGSALYNVPEGVYLTGSLDANALAESLNQLAARHEILRTTFAARGQTPAQEPHEQAEIPLEQVDLTHLPEGDRKAEAERLARAEARRPFDLTRLPLLRAYLYRLGASEHLLLLNMHHIVADGWSLGILHAELSAIYNALKSGQELALPPLPVQYADFAVWQRQHLTGQEQDRQQAYWLQELAGAPTVLALPTDRPRPAVQSYRGAYCSRALPADLMVKLDELGRREGATPFMTMLAAFQTLLHRYTGQDDLLVGSAIAGRNRPETEGLIGFFVGTLPMRADFRQQPTFRQLLRQVRQRALGAFAHQDQPLEKLVEVLQPERNLSHSPLVQVLFALQNAHVGRMTLDGVTATEMGTSGVHMGTAKYDLVLTVEQAASGGTAMLEYSTDLFDDATVERLLGHYETLLTAIAADPDEPVATLPLMTSAEEHQVLREWCGQRTDYPAATVHALFAEQARLRPEAVAVTYGDVAMTYAELDRRSSQLANRLCRLGVGPDVLVGLCLERSPLLMVALLGILKAGGAYLPLDPDYPADRIAFMVEDGRTPVLLTQASLADGLPTTEAAVIRLDEETSLAQESDVAPADQNQPDDLAYVIYTSGSTGRPKGTAIPHRAIIRLLFATNYIQLTNADRIAQASNASFDAATFEIWGALLHGGTLVGIAKDVALTPALLAETLRQERITALFLTTALFNQVAREVPDAFNPVGTVMFGGEACDVKSVRAVLAAGGPQRLLHVYGPTESTTFATWYPVTTVTDDAVTVPIGYPLSSTTCYVLDERLQPVPAGVPGELCIGGDGLAREYLNQPDLTEERFVTTPLGRIYRTGDLVRWLPDGTIEFLGRLDHQVKIRGFRIELGEIETALAAHPAVGGAVVVVRADGDAGKRLVAYLKPGESEEVPTAAALRSYLKERLPEYMVPAAFVVLETFPLNPNGKVDRRALPAPAPDRADGDDACTAPRTPLEESLAAIFAEVLEVERVSVTASFFDLGGHSLLATRVASRIREALQVELPLRTLFERPTVADLAAELGSQTGQADQLPPILPVQRDAYMPVSFAQQRLWFLTEWEPESTLYNVPVAYRLTGPLNQDALARSLNALVVRHESFRTTFAEVDGRPVQIIAPASAAAIALDMVNASWEEAERLAYEEGRRPFDLRRGPMLRARLLRLSDQDHMLLLTMHHIISDGWSMKVLTDELTAAYTAYAAGREPVFALLPVQYADVAVWQQTHLVGAELERQAEYWRRHLAGAPPLLELPTDRPRPPILSYRGGHKFFAVPSDLAAALERLSSEAGTTLFMTLLAAWSVLLHRYARQEEVVIGTPVANRGRRELEGLVGFFANTLALRITLTGEPTFRELLRRVKETALGAYVHQDLPFEKLLEELQPERNMSYTPVFQVMFAFQEDLMDDLALPGPLVGRLLEPNTGTAKSDLGLAFARTERGLTGSLEYFSDLFDPATIDRMISQFLTLLVAVTADPAVPVSRLAMLPEPERRQLLDEWNRTEEPYPRHLYLHALFEQQAAATPDATALVCGEESLTYAELNRRANQLARHLEGLGVGPDVPVGISLERGSAMVVALLAVLKAGGAYVPLDPSYPQERLAYMLSDSQAPVLLVHGGAPVPFGGRVVDLVLEGPQIAALDDADLGAGAGPENLAYVIYTSGSTGRPKGVAVEHRNAVNFLTTFRRQPGMTAADTLLAVTSISFDIHVLELFLTLTSGARLVLATRDAALDGRILAQMMAQHGVTVMQGTPATWRLLLEAGWRSGPSLKMLVGGEALAPDLAARLREGGGELWNVYGPTETTVWSTIWRVTDGPILIGRPIGNTQVYLLDSHLQPVPVGVAGELFIGGDGLARGYLNRPDLTAERFIASTWGRLYRTGDLARYRPDGQLECLGRVDFQVKVRGFRIELGEIEATLAQHPAVAQAVVVVREDTPGDRSIAAYLVSRGGGGGGCEAAPSAADLRGHLKARLPDYMIPSAFVRMDRLPLTPGGKVDRKALPRPEAAAVTEGRAYTAPRTFTEESLAAIWSQVLDVAQVGIEDNYFELGGDSIKSIRVRALAEERGLRLSLQDLFRCPTIRELARVVQAQSDEAGGAGAHTAAVRTEPFALLTSEDRAQLPAGLDDAYPASALQVAMLVQSLSLPEAYRNMTGYTVRLAFDAEALGTAARQMVRRHPILRTAFDFGTFSEPLQLVYPTAELVLDVADLRHLMPDGRAAELEQWVAAELKRVWDWNRAPLARLTAHRLTDDQFRVTVAYHHAIFDGWSVNAFLAELLDRYKAILSGAGEERPVVALPVGYRDYVALEREALASEASRAFWREQLADAPARLTFGGPATKPGTKQAKRYLEVPVEQAVSDKLGTLARQHALPVKCLLLAAHLRAFAVATDRDDVVTGLVTNGRPEVTGGDEILGLFLNTVPLRVRQPGGTWLELARQVLAAETTLLPHRRFPLSEMQVPPIETYFNYGNFQEGSDRPEVVDVVNNAWSGLSLATHFYMDPIAGRLRIIMEYDGYRFTNGQADVLGRCYERVLTALTADPNASYMQADLLPDADRQILARGPLVRPDMSQETARQLLDRLDELTDDEVEMLLALMDDTKEETA